VKSTLTMVLAAIFMLAACSDDDNAVPADSGPALDKDNTCYAACVAKGGSADACKKYCAGSTKDGGKAWPDGGKKITVPQGPFEGTGPFATTHGGTTGTGTFTLKQQGKVLKVTKVSVAAGSNTKGKVVVGVTATDNGKNLLMANFTVDAADLAAGVTLDASKGELSGSLLQPSTEKGVTRVQGVAGLESATLTLSKAGTTSGAALEGTFTAKWSAVAATDFQVGDAKLSLPYRYLAPLNNDPKKKYPVLFFFHGAGAAGSDNKTQIDRYPAAWADAFARAAVRQRYPGYLVAPQGAGSDGTKAATFVKEVLARYNIDTNRVYATGLSAGAMATMTMLNSTSTGTLAAAALFAGSDKAGSVTGAKGVPLWLFHGDDDPSVAVSTSRTVVSTLRADGHAAVYTEYTEAPGNLHDCWFLGYADPALVPWMYAQSKAGGAAPAAPTNVKVTAAGNMAAITWDMPSSAGDIMNFHVYRGSKRLTSGLGDLTGADGSGLTTLLRKKSYTAAGHTTGDTYKVTAVNYRGQESK